jgi:hypothetical protein
MTALNLIKKIEKSGGQITTEEGKLNIVAPAGIVNDTLKKQLIKHKAEIIELLKVNFSTVSNRNYQNRAQGYGCAGCGCKTYQPVFKGWKCEGCKAFYEIIGGSRGPVFIH